MEWPKPVRHNYWACVQQLMSLCPLEPVICNKRRHCNEKPVHYKERKTRHNNKDPAQQQRPSTTNNSNNHNDSKLNKMIFKINKYTKGGKRSQELMMWRAERTRHSSGFWSEYVGKWWCQSPGWKKKHKRSEAAQMWLQHNLWALHHRMILLLVLKCKIKIFNHCFIGKSIGDKLQNSIYVTKTLCNQ